MEPNESIFNISGTVTEKKLYVERLADKQLFAELSRGEFCYVLAPRRIGKSSLRFQTMLKLREAGYLVANIDLQIFIVETMSEEQFYAGLLFEIIRSLRLDFDRKTFWQEKGELHWKQRWSIFLRELVKNPDKQILDKKIIVFVDEIDQVRRLSFSCDDFFSSIRGIYEERPTTPDLNRLTFCLTGVATPDELIKDSKVTPFNIGKAIQLEDFTWEEMKDFLPGLKKFGNKAEPLLKEIYKWTNGHPSMSQRILTEVDRAGSINGNLENFISDTVRKLFDGRKSDSTLAYAERRININE